MVKLPSIAAYNTIHKYDFICVSETYLDSSVRTDDKDILIYGYNLICADHPSNNKRGDVCIYYQESFAVELVETNYLSECLLCEVSINNKKGYVTVLYRSPSQNSLEFDNFILNFEMVLSDINPSNPHFSIILGDFNARCQRIGGKVILKLVKDPELIISQLLMVSNNNIRTNKHFKEFLFLY